MMDNREIEERLMNIEIALANQERITDDLNQVIISQGKMLDVLQKQNQLLLDRLENGDIKQLSEETPAGALLEGEQE